MKGSYLGELQEIVLLAVMVLDQNAYGVTVQKEIKAKINRSLSRGALHSALARLEQKGFLGSHLGGATAERGGRQKRLYTITRIGEQALEEAQRARTQFYQQLPEIAHNLSIA